MTTNITFFIRIITESVRLSNMFIIKDILFGVNNLLMSIVL